MDILSAELMKEDATRSCHSFVNLDPASASTVHPTSLITRIIRRVLLLLRVGSHWLRRAGLALFARNSFPDSLLSPMDFVQVAFEFVSSFERFLPLSLTADLWTRMFSGDLAMFA